MPDANPFEISEIDLESAVGSVYPAVQRTLTVKPTTPTVKLDLSALNLLTDLELDSVRTEIYQIKIERLKQLTDPESVIEQAFGSAFYPDGLPKAPFMLHGFIVCAGATIQKSSMSHRCRFISVRMSELSSPRWSWESEAKVSDKVLRASMPHAGVRTVTLLAPVEGMILDQVSMQASSGQHTPKKSQSFQYANGLLLPSGIRAITPSGHRSFEA